MLVRLFIHLAISETVPCTWGILSVVQVLCILNIFRQLYYTLLNTVFRERLEVAPIFLLLSEYTTDRACAYKQACLRVFLECADGSTVRFSYSAIVRVMGCCCSQLSRVSEVVGDPDIFHTEATCINDNGDALNVLLYVKNDNLYEAIPWCGIPLDSTFQGLSNIDVEVMTGTVTVLDHPGTRVLKGYHINLGLITKVSGWYGDIVNVYGTPDAVELTRKIDPHLCEVTIEPKEIKMTIRQFACRSSHVGLGNNHS